MPSILESALLIHGLKGVSNEAIAAAFGDTQVNIVWLEAGRPVIGGLERFLDFRARVRGESASGTPLETVRANHFNLESMADSGADGVMTASGAMSIAAREGLDAAVTAGIGGFFPGMLRVENNDAKMLHIDIGGKLVCDGRTPPDIATLEALPVTLVSSGPKDMLDIDGIFRYLVQQGVAVCGLRRNAYSGYLFAGEDVPIPSASNACTEARTCETGRHDSQVQETDRGDRAHGICGQLLINEIPEEKRIADRAILDEAVMYAREAEKQGAYYHPAVNAKIEELTGGYSAHIQLDALAENAHCAGKL